jgi:signal transduction histidine kinase
VTEDTAPGETGTRGTGLRWGLSSRAELALLTGVSAVEVATVPDLDAVRLVVCLAAVAVLPLGRRHPVPVLLATLPAAALGLLLLAPMSAMYLVARTLPRLRPVLACAALLGCAGVAVWWWPGGGGTVTPEDAVFGVLHGATLAGGPTAVGRLVRLRAELSDRVRELTAFRERERRLLAERVVAGERARLAREMHDVVSHQVGLITVQAGALEVSTADPASRDAAAVIRRLGAATLDELRVMVGVLRRGGGPATDGGPGADGPGLREVPELVSASGLDVRYAAGRPPSAAGRWPRAVEQAAFRTVQEALTNVRKYAPEARVDLTLAASPDGTCLVVEVANGPGRPAAAGSNLAASEGMDGSEGMGDAGDTGDGIARGRSAGGGYGLLGLRERADQLGGTLAAGPDGAGGFRVRTELPAVPPAQER